jgi:hypothetical protein
MRGEKKSDLDGKGKKACCGAAEIVRLILDGKLARVGRLAGADSYMSVLVDYEEIRRLVRGPALDGLTAEMVMKEMRTTHKVVKALIGNGMLKTARVINPQNRCPVEVVSRADFDALRREYVPSSELSDALGRHRLVVQAMMVERGVLPALRREDYGAAFYRRAEVS